LDASQWETTPWRTLLAAARDDGLVPQFATDFRRTKVPLALPEGTRASLCLDLGEVRDGRGHASPIAEMEVELDDGALASLFHFVDTIGVEVPLAIETRSKAERGYALRTGDRRTPARATHPAVEPDDAAAAALATLLRACVAQVADNADGTVRSDDPEWVHQLRIGTRRLRSLLALLRDCVPEERRATVAADAQWLARALGPVRDLDVLVDETLPHARKGADPAARRVLAAFARRARGARIEARAAARSAVGSPRFTRLILGTGALAATPGLGAAARTAGGRTLAASVAAFARPWLQRRHRKLARLARGLDDATPEERHEVRLAAKRLRYAAEFFAGAYPGGRTRDYRKALARLQDALGAQVDAQVAVRLALAIEGAASPAAHLLEAQAARDAHAADARLSRRWRAFRDAPRFFEA
jgi:inorganic triphosphatase YgiF